MRFFTTTNVKTSSFCIAPLKSLSRVCSKTEVFVDPGVYDLIKGGTEYSQINELEQKVFNLAPNEHISIDYVVQFAKDTKTKRLFTERTFQNNLKYKTIKGYTCAIQAIATPLEIENTFLRYECWGLFDDKEKQYAIPKRFLEVCPHTTIAMIQKYLKGCKVHVFGLGMRTLRKWGNIIDEMCILSIDSTKWTKAITKEVKQMWGLNCKAENRDWFFLAYMEVINKFMEVVF